MAGAKDEQAPPVDESTTGMANCIEWRSRLVKRIAVEALCNGRVVRHESDDRGGGLTIGTPTWHLGTQMIQRRRNRVGWQNQTLASRVRPPQT